MLALVSLPILPHGHGFDGQAYAMVVLLVRVLC